MANTLRVSACSSRVSSTVSNKYYSMSRGCTPFYSACNWATCHGEHQIDWEKGQETAWRGLEMAHVHER
jgi:hypothetical protein